jgi:histidyl-tRNA synthetase
MAGGIRAIRGFKDIPPDEAWKHRYIEDEAIGHLDSYGYREIKLPMVEPTELFARGIGEATDIVDKEMYTFEDRNGLSITLRPEGTASAVRACLENNWLGSGGMAKVFYSGPMFRYERPQKGRYRQFFQIGVEAFGGAGPLVDAEVIDLLHKLFVRLGVDDVTMKVNSLGCDECRPGYREALVSFLSGKGGELCENCRRRTDTNPMRVLDCKVPSCQEALVGAPVMLDHLCGDCTEHFGRVREALDSLQVPYEVDPTIVRGLDYYNRTAFEAVCGRLGSQNAVAAGGRYDGLAVEIGGQMPGIGFAIGVERLGLLMDWEKIDPPGIDIYVAAATQGARTSVMMLADSLRAAGFSAVCDLEDRRLKAQMKSADKLGVGRVIIIGDDEMARGEVQLKDFIDGTQTTLALDDLLSALTDGETEAKGAP